MHVPPFEREVELRLADERLRVQRRLAPAHVHVVAVEGDVDRPEVDLDAAELLDQPAQAVREGTPRVWMPISATWSRSAFASMISCAIR